MGNKGPDFFQVLLMWVSRFFQILLFPKSKIATPLTEAEI